MQTLFTALDALFYSAARCAAALGITRQAYHQARTRRRLSDRAAIRAAALLKIDAGQALFINATGQNPPAPKCNPTPNLPHQPPRQPSINAATHPLYYVKSLTIKM